MTRSEIEAHIADICEQMKGPMSNVERAWLHADRKELRAMLAALPADGAGAANEPSRDATPGIVAGSGQEG